MNQRYLSIDILKILAIFGVIFIHVAEDIIWEPLYPTNLTWALTVFLAGISQIAVPLFVIASGYLVVDEKYESHSYRKFILKKLQRIGIPLVFWTVCLLLWNQFVLQNKLITIAFISQMILSARIFHLYFLIVITELYLITPFIKNHIARKTSTLKRYIFFALTFTGIAMFLGNIYDLQFVPYNIFTIFLFFLGYFLFGMYVRKNPNSNFIHANKTKLIMLFLILLFLTVALSFANKLLVTGNTDILWRMGRPPYFLDRLSVNIMCMSLLAFVLLIHMKTLFGRNLRDFNKLIATLANTTFGIFLVHTFIIDILNFNSGMNILRFPNPILIFLLLKVLVVYFLSFIIVWTILKIPVLNLVVGGKTSAHKPAINP